MTQHKIELIQNAIRSIPDFPKPGILFRDIAPLMANAQALSAVFDIFEERYTGTVDAIAGIEARGFIFGVPLADRLKLPFVMIRKPGKLPGNTISQSYALEYGENTLQIQENAFPKGTRILLIDDLLATGGSANAAADLIQKAGGIVEGIAFVIELSELNGRKRIEKLNPFSIVSY